ncbi:hypothetical protein [Pseudoalteromonas piratica]|nr:hypothetical protein [Pseudoalteromonas piratica]
MMQTKNLKIGEWVEYQNHPVSVVDIDSQKLCATVWDAQNDRRITVSTDELNDDPQCHCDSHHYY